MLILRSKDISEDRFYFFVDKLIFELSKIHNFSQFHGGSQLRNFTFKDDKVFVLDFEESFETDVDIKTLQYRDFLLFLLSFIKIKETNFKIDYEKIINKYCELTNNIEFKQKLIRFSKKLRFFLWIYEKDFIKKRVGSDVKYFLSLYRYSEIIKLREKFEKYKKNINNKMWSFRGFSILYICIRCIKIIV